MSSGRATLSAEVTAICDQLRVRDPGRQVLVTDGAAIEFATAPVDDAPICCYVRDNGAGFDPAYAGQPFQPVQRLHDADEFPGTGMGLASARPIIERHGGRTWAEGAVDGGATIYFTLNAEDTRE